MPATATALNMWGISVVLTTQMPANTGIVANLSLAATAFVWQAPTLEVAPTGGGTTEFISNQTLARAEERRALAVMRPTAIVKVTGLNEAGGTSAPPPRVVHAPRAERRPGRWVLFQPAMIRPAPAPPPLSLEHYYSTDGKWLGATFDLAPTAFRSRRSTADQARFSGSVVVPDDPVPATPATWTLSTSMLHAHRKGV